MNPNTLTFYSITPFTTVDYPDEIAAVAWFAGCNMRCAYCYNKQVVISSGQISIGEFLAFLDKRVGRLSGIVFSGGECTLSGDFLDLAMQVKKRNFKLKVDTNGSNLTALKDAVELDLIDFIALDFKATRQKFKQISGGEFYDDFIKTLQFLVKSKINFEVRTSIHADLLDENDISQMADILQSYGYNGTYHLQGFLDTGENFGNLKTAKKSFNPKKINSNLNINLRNFI